MNIITNGVCVENETLGYIKQHDYFLLDVCNHLKQEEQPIKDSIAFYHELTLKVRK